MKNILENAEKKGISVRWKLVFYMSAFVVVFLIVTWFFQIFLLGTFFRSVKRNEMEEVASTLSEKVGTGGLASAAFNAAVDHTLCVTVYRIEEGQAQRVADADATGSNLTVSLSSERLAYFYDKATENEGSYFSRVAFGGYEVESDLLDQLPGNENASEGHRIPGKSLRLIYVRLTESSNQQQYMIVLDAGVQPLNSTVRTLSTQYVWIAVIILIAALVMVLILYRKISAPLVRMNNSAKLLALGKYDVEFSGKGYRETRELAETLNYASRELSRVDRLQKELIANISHDLRTPLTMIKGYSEVMRDIPEENTPENMQVIIDETERLSDLVSDLLDLSRIQSGAWSAKPELFDLTDAVYQVMKRYDALVRHRGYRLEFVAEQSAWVSADHGMVLQVLYNLINNALNYTGEDRSVTVRQSFYESNVRISVTDTGEGIEPEQFPLIWDRYYKVDKVHRRAMIGTGLGLSIVKEILELHSARYGVESTPGIGSTFWFELPAIEGSFGTSTTEQNGENE